MANKINEPTKRRIVGRVASPVRHVTKGERHFLTVRVSGLAGTEYDSEKKDLVITSNDEWSETGIVQGLTVGDAVDIDYEERISGKTEYADDKGNPKKHSSNSNSIVSVAMLGESGVREVKSVSAEKRAMSGEYTDEQRERLLHFYSGLNY